MNDSQQVTTKFIWDTGSVEKGARTYEKAMDRIAASDEKTSRKVNGGGGGGAHGGGHKGMSNFAWGLHDIAEGRVTQGLMRLTSGMGKLAAAAGGAFIAFKIGKRLVEETTKAFEKNEKASERMYAASMTSSRAAAGANAGQGAGALTAQIGSLDKEFKERRELLEDLDDQRKKLTGQSDGSIMGSSPILAAARSLIPQGVEGVRTFMGHPSTAQQQEIAKMEAKLTAKDRAKLFGTRSENLSAEKRISEAGAPGGNPAAGKWEQIDLQQKEATAAATLAGYSKQDLKTIKERYEILKNTVNAEQAIATARYDFASAALGVEGSGRSQFGKTMELAQDRADQSGALIRSGALNLPQQRAEHLNALHAQNEQRAALEGRYLGPDGRPRNMRDVLKDERTDALETRRKNHFIKRIEAGGFDPATGKMRVTGDRPGSGLHTGHLGPGPAGDGLRTGHLSEPTDFAKALMPRLGKTHMAQRDPGDEEEWRAQFRPKKPQVYGPPESMKGGSQSTGDGEVDWLKKIYDALPKGGR